MITPSVCKPQSVVHKTSPADLSSRVRRIWIVLVLLSVAAFAGAQTWDGSDSSDLSDGNNWVGGVAPLNDGSATIVIPDSSTTPNDPVLTFALDLADLQVQSSGFIDLAGFDLSTTTITNEGLIRAAGTQTVTINGNSGNAIVDFDTDSGAVEFTTSHTGSLAFGTTYYDLIVTSPLLRPADALFVNRNLTISGLLDSNASSADVTIGGNFTASGSFTPGSSTTTFTGSSGAGPHTIDPGALVGFNNVVIDDGGGGDVFQMADDLDTTVGSGPGNLTLISGTLDLNGFSVTVAGDVDVSGGTLSNPPTGGELFLFNGGGAQSLTPGGQNLGDAQVSGAGTAVTQTGTAVMEFLTVDAATTYSLDGSAAAVTLQISDTGTIINNGSFVVGDDTNTVTLEEASGGGTFNFLGTDIDYNGRSIQLARLNFIPAVILSAGENIVLTDNVTFPGGITLNGAGAGLNAQANTLVTANSNITNTQGTVTVGAGGQLSLGTGDMDNQAAGVLTTSGTILVDGFTSTGTVNNPAANSITASGNVAISGTFNTPANSSFTMNGTAFETLNATVTIGDIEIDGDIVLANDLVMDGDFTITSGELDANTPSYDITLTGDWTNNGIFLYQTSTVTLNPAAGTSTLNSGGAVLQRAFYDLQVAGAPGTIISVFTNDVLITRDLTVVSGELDINGQTVTADRNVSVSGGELDAGTGTLIVGRNWNNAATFTAGTSEVRLVGANPADVTGDTGFHDLTIDSATGKTVSFENGSTQTVADDFRAEGAVGFPVLLQSDSAGVFWNLDVSAATSAVVDYVSVIDGDLVDAANPGAAVDVSPTTAGSSITDANSDIYSAVNDPGSFGADNVRWLFPISYTWDNGGLGTLWGTAGNWSPNGVPGLNDDATIPDAGGPYAVGLGAAESVNNLTIESTATLDLLGNDLSIQTTISNDGTIRSQGTEVVTITGVSPPTSAEFDTDSGTVVYYQSTVGALVFGNTYFNLTVGDGGGPDVVLLTAPLDVNGDLTIAANGELDAETGPGAPHDVSVGGDWDNTAGGRYVSGANTTTFDATAGPVTITTGGTAADQDFQNLTINDGGGGVTFILAGDLDVDGALTVTGGTLQTGANSVTVGAGATVNDVLDATGQGAGDPLSVGVDLAGTGSVSAGAGLVTVGGDISVDTFVGDTGNIDVAGSVVSGTSFTASSGTTFVGGDLQPAVFADNNGTVELDGAAAATVDGLTFHNLTINKAALGDTVASGAGWDVTNGLTLTRGNWVAGGFTHSVAGNWDSSAANFVFTEGTSTIQLTSDGIDVTTKGAGDQFSNLTVLNGTLGSGVTFQAATTVSGLTTARGALRSAGLALNLGNLTLTNGLLVDTTNSGAAPAGATVTLGAVTSAGNGLTLNAGTGGDVLASSFAGGGDLTITNSDDTTISGGITAGAITLTDSSGTISLHGTVNATSLSTAAQGYNLSILGAGSVIGGNTDLLNTGTLQLGNAGTDTVQFTGGLGATSTGTISVAGTVSTVGTQMDIGALTLTANAVLDTGAAGASVLNVGAVSSAGFELTLDSGPNAALDLASFAGGGDLVVRDANGGTLGSAGAVTLSAFTLQDSTIALALGNALTASGAIDLQAGSFSMGGNPITVAGDWTVAAGVNFLNTNQPVTFNASAADQTITTSGTAADKDYYDVIVDTSGGFAAVLNGDILINRDLVFNSGAAVLDDGGNLLIVERNWDNTAGGTLTATGNLRFDDAAQTTQVLGATAFSDLTVTEDGKTVRFQSGQQQTVNGTLTVTGSAGAANLITLEPTVAATDWLLDNVGNSESIAFAVISYSDASAGAVVNATNSKDVQDTGASSNTNWDFGNSNLQWLGVNSNWDDDANWNNGYVPNPTDNVTIPDVGSAPNMPVLDTAGEGDETNNLTLTDPTSALTFTGAANDLTVNGVFSFNGTLNLEGDETLSASVAAGVAAAAAADQGTVIYGGQDALGLAAGDTYYNLEVSANTYTLDTDLTVEGDITLSGGVLNAGAGPFNVTVHGQWTNSGGAYQPLTNTTTFTGQDGAGPFLIQTGGTAPGQQFANLTVDSPTNNRVFQLANNALATTGAVVIAAGDTLDAENGTGGPHNLSVGGSWTNAGVYLPGANTTTFSGAGGAGPYDIDTGGTAAGQDFYRVVVGGGANQTYRLANNDLLVVEDLSIDAGDTLDAENGPGGPHNITVGQDYTNNGSFISGAGTVTFDGRTGAGPFLINSGGTAATEDFGTVVFGAGSDLVYRLVGNSFTAAGSVTIDTGDELDVQGFSLTATPLNNNGSLRREGSGESVTRDNDSGLVIYDGAGGTVENYDDFVADYFELEIAANQSVAGGDLIQTTQDLTVSSGTLSLTGDILTGRDLIIIAGAGVNGGSSTIQIGRNWTNGAGVGGFAAGSSTVELVAAATSTIQVTGNTNFYNLERNTGDIVIEFGAGETFGILPGGSLVLTGTGPADIESRVAAEFLPPPDSPPALSFAGQITITSTAPGPAPADRWIFDPDPSFTLTMQYVVVAYSETLINVVLPPLNILGPNTVNWLTFLPVSSSETIDTDSNGRIDRILVTLPVNHNNNFADMEVTVTGYTVTGIGPAVAPDQFIIDLAEKVELDTEVTPSWVIDQNTSLRDNISSTRIVVILTPPEVPVDSAPPIVAHTLAYSGGSQIYLRFSEPVFQIQPGTAPGPADFTVGGGTPPTVTSVTPVDAVGNGYEELLLFLDRPLGTADLAPPVSLSVNPVVEDGADRVILDPVVSISSLALTTGATPPITPVYAIDETITDPLSGGLGIIRDFDGSAFLTPETITMQVFREAGLPAPQLLYDSDVSAAVKPNGVWLPFELPGLTRDPYLTPLPAVAGSAVNAQLTEFTLPSTDARIRENVVLEFLIDTGLTTEISGSTVNYYAARLDTEMNEPWYYSARPFAFDLQNLVVQRGGVTIANNVIDPTAGQRATLNYTLESRQLVRVFVLDLAGALVKTVQNGIQNPGEYSLVWDGTNREGRPVSTGVYFVRIVAGETDEIRKVLVIRE